MMDRILSWAFKLILPNSVNQESRCRYKHRGARARDIRPPLCEPHQFRPDALSILRLGILVHPGQLLHRILYGLEPKIAKPDAAGLATHALRAHHFTRGNI